MQSIAKPSDSNSRYRERVRAAGEEEVLVRLPRETIALLDAMKVEQRLRSRSQALRKLIEEGRRAAQKTID